MQERKIITLDSGIQIVTDPSTSAETLSINVSFRAGSCDEGNLPSGIAHFMEHMAFKGTERRSVNDINREIVGQGGCLNASTDQDTTHFTCVTLADQLEQSMDVLADIVTKPLLAKEAIETERGVVLQELSEGEGTWATFNECFDVAAFGEADISRPIIGTEDGVKAIDAQALRSFVERHYVTGNLVVAVAGNIESERVRDLVAEKFGGLRKGARTPMPTFAYVGGEQGFACSCDKGLVRYGFNAPTAQSPDYRPVQLFNAILGTGPAARLTMELREERGLVYDVRNSWRQCCGSHITWYETQSHAKNIREVFSIMHDQIFDALETVTEEELQSAKRMWIVWSRMSRDEMRDRTMTAVNNLFADGYLEAERERIAGIEAVDLATMKSAARRYLSGAPSLAVHGPARGLPKLALAKPRTLPVAA